MEIFILVILVVIVGFILLDLSLKKNWIGIMIKITGQIWVFKK